MRSLLLLLNGILLFGAQAVASPPNDNCGAATVIAGLPFTITVDATTATTEPTDPVQSCSAEEGAQSIWFTYTARRRTTLLIDSIGSDAHTTISVHSGSCVALSEVACESELSGTPMLLPVAKGQTILLDVTGPGGHVILHVAQAAIDASPPVSLRDIVTSGTPDPLGGAFSSFAQPIALSATDVAFGGTTEGIFLHEGSTLTAVAIAGDPSPVGGTFSDFGPPVAGRDGTVIFSALLDDAPTSRGVFLHRGGTTSVLVAVGSPAPGGGQFRTIRSGVAVSPSSAIGAFVGDTTLDSRDALYLTAGGSVTGPLLKTGDPSPCGGTIRGLGAGADAVMAVNAFGSIALFARSTGAVDGVLLFEGGAWHAVACEKHLSPLGGTYRAIGGSVRLTDGVPGAVTFYTTHQIGTVTTAGVWVGFQGGAFPIAQAGDVLSGGQTILSFGSSNAVVDGVVPGAAAYFARTTGGDAIVRHTGPTGSAILFEGDPCPFGGTITQLAVATSVDPLGTVVVGASCSGRRVILRIPLASPPVLVASQEDVTSGGAGFVFSNPTIEGTTVAFSGSRTALYGMTCDALTCGPISVLARPLTPMPGVPGQTITLVDPLTAAGQGKLIAFRVSVSDGTEAIVALRNGTPELIAASAMPVPGTTTTISDFSATHVSVLGADKRGVGFVANILDSADGAMDTAVLLAARGGLTELARTNHPSPDGGLYVAFDTPLVRGSHVFFQANSSVAGTCYVDATAGRASDLTCQGDALAIPPGGTLDADSVTPGPAALGSRGPVFRAGVSGGSTSECLFSPKSGGTVGPVACANDLLPGGGSIANFELLEGTLAASGRRVTCRASGNNSLHDGIYTFSPGAAARIASISMATPVGGTFGLGQQHTSMYGKTVLLLSDIVDGTRQRAIFRAVLKR